MSTSAYNIIEAELEENKTTRFYKKKLNVAEEQIKMEE